ncbi:MAG: hypothetical protein GKR89_22720 [Candidatus Latescibacteria bacterium]|nr:hypothetical protein [Candidatus Latescibacterota bacterium]
MAPRKVLQPQSDDQAPIPQSCDTMVAPPTATRHGQMLFAKNSDRPWDECQPLELHPRREHAAGTGAGTQFVDVPQVATTYRHVGSRPWWCWGYEHGFNEHQVAIGNEALPSRLEEAGQARLVGMEILRLGLERGRTAAQAVEVMTALIAQFGQGKFANQAGVRTYDNGYIIADPTEAFVLETAGHDWAVKRADRPLGISNVYSLETDYQSLSPQAATRARQQGWADTAEPFNFAAAFAKGPRDTGSGAQRRHRSCAVLDARYGSIGVDTMINLLRDHGGADHPAQDFHTRLESGGICVHFNQQVDGNSGGGNTAASLVADLCADGTRLPVYWCSFYSPCLAPFFPVFIETELPPILAQGGEHAQDQPDSPWWKFHQLNILARQGGPETIALVQQHWAHMQQQWMSTAYDMATQGKGLLDAGENRRAGELLTDYVNANVASMLGALDELHQTLGQQLGAARS